MRLDQEICKLDLLRRTYKNLQRLWKSIQAHTALFPQQAPGRERQLTPTPTTGRYSLKKDICIRLPPASLEGTMLDIVN